MTVVFALWWPWASPAQGARGRGGPPPTAKAGAPIDLTGYWTAVLTEDWHVRMFTASKGDFGSGPPGAVAQIVTGRLGVGANPAQDGNIPYNLKGAQAAVAWDAASDEAAGQQCKAYGAPGIMRQPTHLRVTWADDNTLKVEADFGTQTRLFHFAPPAQAPAAATCLINRRRLPGLSARDSAAMINAPRKASDATSIRQAAS